MIGDELGDDIRYPNGKVHGAPGQTPHDILNLPANIKNLVGVAINDSPNIREYEATSLSGKQFHPETLFEIADLGADGLRCQKEFGTCACEITMTRHSPKVFEMLVI